MSEGIAESQAALTFQTSPSERLRDSEVEKFFLGILRSELPPEAKYQKFVEFFDLDTSLSREIASRGHELLGDWDEGKMEEVLATAAVKAGVWQPQEILTQTDDCLVRAVRRLIMSQHSDGGWGFEVERSNTWATALAALALYMADIEGVQQHDVAAASERGLDWLVAHRGYWSVMDIPPTQDRSIYELSTVIRCLHETNRIADRAVDEEVSACIDGLASAQNDDGGWDRSVWGTDWLAPTGIWSETGATSFALQALAIARGKTYEAPVLRGLDRLVSAQNSDGSWNVMIWDNLDRGPRTITKTCDALKGILACRRMGIDMRPYEAAISRGMTYIHGREQPFFDDERTIAGWGWEKDKAPEEHTLNRLENTCHTLETLLQVEDTSLPLLTSNASWLIQSQHRDHGSIDDGNWAGGMTERITLSLLHFYKAIKASPLFASATANA